MREPRVAAARRGVLALAGLVLAAGARAQPLEARLGEAWRWRELRSPHASGTHEHVAVDGRGVLLSLTGAGVHLYEDGAWRTVPVAWGEGERPEQLVPLGRGWLASRSSGRVVRIDPSGRLHATGLPRARPPAALHALDGRVFVQTGDALVEHEGRGRRLPLEDPTGRLRLGADARGRVVMLDRARARIETDDGWAPLPLPVPLREVSEYACLASAGDTTWLVPVRLDVPLLELDDGAVRAHDARLLATGAFGLGEDVVVSDRRGGLRVLRDGRVLEVGRVPGIEEQIRGLRAGPGGRLLALTASGRLWACDLRSERWARLEMPTDTDFVTVSSLAFDAEGGLWVGSDHGVFRGTPAGLDERIVEAAGQPLHSITTVCVDARGHVWVGSGSAFDGALRHDGRRWERVIDELGPHGVHAIERGPDDALWFTLLGHHGRHGDDGGLVRYDGETWTRWGVEDGLPSNRCYDVLFADDGSVYAGTLQGVARRDGERWVALGELAGVRARAMHETPDGALWVASGINDPGVWRVGGPPLALPEDLGRLTVGAFASDGDELWMAAVEGLYLLRGPVLLEVTRELHQSEPNLWPMRRGPGGDLWLGSLGSGVLRYRPDDEDPPRLEEVRVVHDDDTGGYAVHWRAVDAWQTTTAPDLHHRWRLDGGTWSDVERAGGSVALGPLEPGRHAFELEVYDLGGNVARLDAPLAIDVPPPLLLRPLVIGPLAALGLLLAWAGVALVRHRRERRRAAERERARIAASERHHRGLVERASVLFASADRQGVLTYVGPGLTRYVSPPPRTMRELLAAVDPEPDEDGERAGAAPMLAALARGHAHRAELPFRRTDGTRAWLLVTLSPRVDPDGADAGGVDLCAVDVTDRRAAERERRRLEERLRQARKLEAIGQLAAGVAHDVNNVLTAIVANAELLRHELEAPGAEARARVDGILDATARARLVTQQLLAFGRRQVLAPRVLDLGTVLREIEPLLWRLLPETIRLELVPGEDVAPIVHDVAQLQQVVLNLVINARDAMPGGGRLRIETRATPRERARLADGAASGHAAVPTLVVRDDGEGMDERVRARIFEPFFTTKDVGEGTGLGLATVHGIVEQSGGGIAVHSEVGHGTTFEVFFVPAGEDASAQGPAGPARERGAPARRAGTILLCEDDPAVLELTRRLLEPHAARILTAATPDEALARARAHEGAIDVLVTDVVMPGGDGLALAAALRAERPGTPVLLVSGYAPGEEVAGALVEGEVEFLHKPFGAEELAERVLRLAGEAAGDPRHGPLPSGSDGARSSGG